MPEVFVSYARSDIKVVTRIMRKLHSLGFEYWMDTRSVPGGTQWMEEITHGIKECKVVLLFMSAASLSSDSVRREITLAYSKKKRIVILRLEDVPLPDSLIFQLGGINWIDYFAPEWDTKVVVALRSHARRRAVPATGNTTKVKSGSKRITPMQDAKKIAVELESFFSRGGEYYKDECKHQLERLVELGNEISILWDKSPADFQQLTSKVYLLDKVTAISRLVREFRGACPPGSSDKRETIRRDLEHLIDDLSMK